MEIVQLKKESKSALDDINNLLIQLRGDTSNNRGSLNDLHEVVKNQNVVMVVAKDGERIVGMGFLYLIIHVGRRSGHVEDVVVDKDYRGQGLGERIMKDLIGAARKNKLETIYLTSKPERLAANHLYQKLGFVRKETNVYKLPLENK